MKPGHDSGKASGQRASWRRFAQVFFTLMLVWIALNGLDGLGIGMLAAAAGTLCSAYFGAGQGFPLRPWRWLLFSAFFLVESFKGGADVAWRALHPTLKIQPEFQTYPVRLAPGLPTTFLTSIISLLPGTLSVRPAAGEPVLIVHALTPSAIASVARLENMLQWLFEPAEGLA
ncbi:MAG: Na+/H+ antiporter subunit E [Wenzhouxiangella sp.]